MTMHHVRIISAKGAPATIKSISRRFRGADFKAVPARSPVTPVMLEFEPFVCSVTHALVTLRYYDGQVMQRLEFLDNSRLVREIVRDYGLHEDLLVPLGQADLINAMLHQAHSLHLHNQKALPVVKRPVRRSKSKSRKK